MAHKVGGMRKKDLSNKTVKMCRKMFCPVDFVLLLVMTIADKDTHTFTCLKSSDF